MEDDQLTVVVLDCGSSTVKAGFSGEDAPRAELPTLVGHARHPGTTGVMHGNPSDVFVGDQAASRRGLLETTEPITRGAVTDWDAMQHVWHHVFFDSLKVACEEHPALVTESPDNTRLDREKMVEMLFESFSCPTAVVANTATLSLYSTGRSSGLVVDSGAGRTHVGPVWEGYLMPHFLRRIDVGGDDMTDLLRDKLRRDGYPFSTAQDRMEVARIKEDLCYSSLNCQRELTYCKESRSIERWHNLPDGQQVFMNEHRFTVPEALFAPELLGASFKGTPALHTTIHEAIQMCDPSIQAELYGAIVLAGGNTLFPSLDERVQREVAALAPSGTTTRAVAFPDRKYAAWLGGSVLGSLRTFPSMWVTKNEYDDYGASIVHRKT
uniref:Actin n=1 Tax=Neobodo designis TaxID=312471 RepID=A0A7S1LV67_NEODS